MLKQTDLYLMFTTNVFSLMKIKDVFKNGFNIYYLSYICNIQESNYYVHYSLRIRFHNYYMFFCVQTWGWSINVRLGTFFRARLLFYLLCMLNLCFLRGSLEKIADFVKFALVLDKCVFKKSFIQCPNKKSC